MPEDIQERLNADTPREQRNLFLWGWLALVALYNLFVIVSLLRGGADPNLGYVVPDLPAAGVGIWLGIVARAAIILFAVMLAMGSRLGWYGLVGAFIVSTIASLVTGFNIGALVEAALVLLVVWLLIRGAWHRMK